MDCIVFNDDVSYNKRLYKKIKIDVGITTSNYSYSP